MGFIEYIFAFLVVVYISLRFAGYFNKKKRKEDEEYKNFLERKANETRYEYEKEKENRD